MDRETDGIATGVSPGANVCRRLVAIGGLTKGELLDRLRANSIALNRSAEMIFECDAFVTAQTEYCVSTVELQVQALGFPQGATLADILAKAATIGLSNCPLELGPHLRLQYVNQPEGSIGQAARPHQAPTRRYHNRLRTVDRGRRLSEGFLSQAYRRRAVAAWLPFSSRAPPRP